MSHCPACSTEVSEVSRFCPSCGARLGTPAGGGTITYTPPEIDARPPVTPSASRALPHGRFTPGTLLAERYRIVALLGKGGMGEVYRADDLKLGVAVALKFLPQDVAKNLVRLEHFHDEVRLARQVSHANVCRVFDIGDTHGEHFISMEYVDGEDLAGLLRRIGRFPTDKGVQIARQLCAGLAAAHENGVLHRDLKPANVSVSLDLKGRLLEFRSVPESAAASDEPPPAADWGKLFEEACLDLAKFTPAAPLWNPPVYADGRAAWEGVYPDSPWSRCRRMAS